MDKEKQSKNMKKVILISFLALLALIVGSQVMAAGLVPCGGQAEPRCTFCDFFVMAENIINFLLFTIVPPLGVLFVVIAGAYFILGSGYDPNLITKGKSILSSVAIGLLILYGSWILVNLFFTMIGVVTWTGLIDDPATAVKEGWWQIDCSSESSSSSMMIPNSNQQAAAASQPLFFVGVNQPTVGEDIPLPF